MATPGSDACFPAGRWLRACHCVCAMPTDFALWALLYIYYTSWVSLASSSLCDQIGFGGHHHVSVSPPSWQFAGADPTGTSTNPLGAPGQPPFPEDTNHWLSFARVLCLQWLSRYLSLGSLLRAACCLGEELRGSRAPLRSRSHQQRWQQDLGLGVGARRGFCKAAFGHFFIKPLSPQVTS